jgi:hypothetical protein
MEENFDRSRGSLPFFSNMVSGEFVGEFDWRFGNSHWEVFSGAHIPGRWLNALLAAESIGYYAPSVSAISRLRDWTMQAFDGPVALPRNFDVDSLQPVPRVLLHNVREGLHALSALIRSRTDEVARDRAIACVHTVDEYFVDGAWLGEKLLADTGIDARVDGGAHDPFTVTLGRAIGPLVKLARDCGIDGAADLAHRLGRHAVEHIFLADGSFDVGRQGSHGHSVTSTLSSLAQLAEYTGDTGIMEHVTAFVENGLRDISLDFGWCLENVTTGRYWGEGNNTADIVETLLILARRDSSHYERVERILRSHLLPSQLIDVGFVSDDLTDDNGLRKLASRTLGGFGLPLPYGHEETAGDAVSFNWDIVGGVVGGLCEVVRQQVTFDRDSAVVNLLFDFSTEQLSILGPYDGYESVIVDVGPALQRVLLRVPSWVDRVALGRWAGQNDGEVGATHLVLPTDARKHYEVPMPLASTRREYRFGAMEFAADYRGDQIVAMSAPGKRLRFFDETAEPTARLSSS